MRSLRRYLGAYFDRLNVHPQREEFRLDLVDGFAGGGLFTDGEATVPGTPIIMLEEAAAATQRLNEGRIKPLNVNCRFYFVDKEAAHTTHLSNVIKERELDAAERVTVRTGRFEDEVDGILQSIKARQPRAGRALFLLDQTGFGQVELALVRRIFSELAAAEVILTFAADALINHLAETPQIVSAARSLELDEARIRDLIQARDENTSRAVVQRALRDDVRYRTGATYDTPFFIRPHQSRRALWFLHLSRHPTARDVMIQQHWNVQNAFEHYGRGDFGMLGWDALRDSETPPLFHFVEADRAHMHEQLLSTLPRELFTHTSEGPVTIEALRHDIANQTAARFSDLDAVILRLVAEGEFDILNREGIVRARSLTRLSATDRIALPSTCDPCRACHASDWLPHGARPRSPWDELLCVGKAICFGYS